MSRRPRRTATHAPPSHRCPADARVLAVDPGLCHPAAAWLNSGVVTRAERTYVNATWSRLGLGDRCAKIATEITEWCDLAPTHVVIEWPQVYTETQSGGVDGNDLVAILGVAMAVVGRLTVMYPDIVVLSPKPSEVWARLPKIKDGDPWASVRGRYIARRLGPGEYERIEPTHDAIDAVGLGYYAFGKMDPVRVFPGAT